VPFKFTGLRAVVLAAIVLAVRSVRAVLRKSSLSNS